MREERSLGHGMGTQGGLRGRARSRVVQPGVVLSPGARRRYWKVQAERRWWASLQAAARTDTELPSAEDLSCRQEQRGKPMITS